MLRAELPGMQRDNITVECRDGMLTVRGEQTIASTSDSAVPRIKHGYRAFARRFVLSTPVAADAIAMTYTHGVLEVHLPKVVEVFELQSPCIWRHVVLPLPCLRT